MDPIGRCTICKSNGPRLGMCSLIYETRVLQRRAKVKLKCQEVWAGYHLPPSSPNPMCTSSYLTTHSDRLLPCNYAVSGRNNEEGCDFLVKFYECRRGWAEHFSANHGEHKILAFVLDSISASKRFRSA